MESPGPAISGHNLSQSNVRDNTSPGMGSHRHPSKRLVQISAAARRCRMRILEDYSPQYHFTLPFSAHVDGRTVEIQTPGCESEMRLQRHEHPRDTDPGAPTALEWTLRQHEIALPNTTAPITGIVNKLYTSHPENSSTPRSDDVDNHYTPTAVAKSLVTAVHDLRPRLIADLSAGRGDLLLEAERKWPTSTFAAADIDLCSVRYLTKMRPSWIVGRCDLRNYRSRSSSRILKEIHGSACLMLLNPPFSCRGGTKYSVHLQGACIFASTAMSFLLTATKYVADNGHIASILPLGSLSSTKDQEAWEYLRRQYHVELVATYPKGTFPNSAATTALVHLSPLVGTRQSTAFTHHLPPSQPILRIRLIRGGCQIHKSQHFPQNHQLIHYTDIRNGSVEINGRRGSGEHACVAGPLVLIPRVGRITVDKVAVFETIERVMLSDCIIAMSSKTIEQALLLRTLLVRNFSRLRESYVGTGAPFITLERLRSVLGSVGVYVE